MHSWGDLGRGGTVSPKAESRGKRKSEAKKGAAEKMQDLRKQGGGPQVRPFDHLQSRILNEIKINCYCVFGSTLSSILLFNLKVH